MLGGGKQRGFSGGAFGLGLVLVGLAEWQAGRVWYAECEKAGFKFSYDTSFFCYSL